ncbi:hypothetical protein [Lentzea sp. NPDC003310]|uniref:hypothetical protein n=1 Tax=Lentzea sp. NPDC003310 TaxID=3154447 RepID=UPI0033A94DDE
MPSSAGIGRRAPGGEGREILSPISCSANDYEGTAGNPVDVTDLDGKAIWFVAIIGLRIGGQVVARQAAKKTAQQVASRAVKNRSFVPFRGTRAPKVRRGRTGSTRTSGSAPPAVTR